MQATLLNIAELGTQSEGLHYIVNQRRDQNWHCESVIFVEGDCHLNYGWDDIYFYKSTICMDVAS